MKIRELTEWGRIVKGVNTTPDVGVNQISIEAGKLGFKVDKDGRPPTLSKKVKGSKTNVLFNMGLAESNWLKNLINLDPQFKAWLRLFKTDPKKAKQTFPKKHVEFLAQYQGESIEEKWSAKYKRSINCSNPKGFSQKAHCAGRKKNEDKELSSVSTIYVDMDGVLADFFGDWAKLMGKDHWTKIDDIMPALQKIRDTENFWLDLPLTVNAKNLLMLIKDVKGEYNILSSPLPDDPNSEPHKREWIKKNLNFFPPKDIIITHDKAKYATTEDGTPNILIDDYGKNIQQWEAAGGVGFKHKDHKFERTAQNIKQHMQEPVESLSQESLTPIAKPITLEIFKEKADLYIKGLIGGFPKEEMKQKLNTLLRKAINQGTVSQQEGSNYIKNRIAEYLDFVKKNPGQPLPERELTKDEEKEKERIVKGMKKNKSDFKDRYGDDAEAVMYATATKMAKEALRSGRYTPDQILEILENFADGKVSGKSRPGRVRRAGASCSGSVTELRAKAKKASGERAKMYHWCANMKSGRNK